MLPRAYGEVALIAAGGSVMRVLSKRWCATLLDSIIMLLILVLAEVILGGDLHSKVSFYTLPLPAAYMIGFEGLTGAACGKRAMGLRVLGMDGRPPGLVRATTRFVLWIFEVLAFPIVAGLCVLLTRQRRRIGDILAETFVIESN